MRTWSIAFAATGLFAGLATVAHAQAPVNLLLPTQGTREIGVSGQFEFSPNSDYTISADYGSFFSRKLEIGLNGLYQYSKPEHGGSGTNLFLGPFADYYFPNASATEPYVGVALGFSNDKAAGGPTTNTFAYGAQVGVKQFLNSNVAAFAEVPWRHYDKHIEGTGKSDSIGLNLGLAFYMR